MLSKETAMDGVHLFVFAHLVLLLFCFPVAYSTKSIFARP